ncbi:MAG TPA: hypothetical protein VJA86_02480 [Candidatus Nanoarchaeia archaeon]|nr:hypothetical protein [Candidatus Nanoarchaeia archaeon]
MQNMWLKKPALNYSKDILGIVQFGSSVIEGSKPNDVDIAVIFKCIPLKQQLEESQKIKKQLEKFSQLPVHIKSFDFYSFFNKGNFAKEDILFYGKNLISGEQFSRLFGMSAKLQVYYSLKNLKKKDKIRFNYLLNGKNGKYGLLRKYKGSLVKPGLIEIEPQYENIFVNAIKRFISDFEVKRVLFE